MTISKGTWVKRGHRKYMTDDLNKPNTDFYLGQYVRFKYPLNDGYEIFPKGSIGKVSGLSKILHWIQIEMREGIDVDVRTYGIEPINDINVDEDMFRISGV